MKHVIFTNNTGSDVRQFDKIIIDCVKNDKPLPEEIADIFTLDIIEVDGLPRGILRFA